MAAKRERRLFLSFTITPKQRGEIQGVIDTITDESGVEITITQACRMLIQRGLIGYRYFELVEEVPEVAPVPPVRLRKK